MENITSKKIALWLSPLAAVGLLLAVLLGAAHVAPAAVLQDLPFEQVVVRAYYDNPELVAALASWTEPWEIDKINRYVVLEVNAAQYQQLVEAGFRVVLDEALTLQINAPLERLPGQVAGIPGFPCYRTVTETFTTAEDLVAAYPQLATWIDIGDSWEKSAAMGGEDLFVLRLTNELVSGPKPKMFLITGIHPREYAPPELNTRFAEYLLDNYDQDPDVTWLLDHHEFHLLLIANPDGRKQAETGLFWRKNTNQDYCSPTSSNRGADLNRNFSFQWGEWGGSSGFDCDDTYRGPVAASEPETQAIQNYAGSIFPDVRDADLTAAAPMTTTGIFLDVHSFSELVLWPWGFTDAPAPNGPALQTLGRKLAYFNGYEPDQAIGLYSTDGTTEDYGYGELGVPSFTFEIGTTFFQDCGRFEREILPDNLDSLLYAAKALRRPYLSPAGPEALNPVLSAAVIGPGEVVTLTATINDSRYGHKAGTPPEPTQAIAAAEAYLDFPDWITATTPAPIPMAAQDGIFDSEIEVAELVLDTAGLSHGRHTIFFRGQDSAGNWGVYSAVFLNILDLDPKIYLPEISSGWVFGRD